MASILTVLSIDFDTFAKKNNKVYKNAEEKKTREKIFLKNFQKNERLNAIAIEKKSSARFGVNKFSDLDEEEFASKYLGVIPYDFRELRQRGLAATTTKPTTTKPTTTTTTTKPPIQVICQTTATTESTTTSKYNGTGMGN